MEVLKTSETSERDKLGKRTEEQQTKTSSHGLLISSDPHISYIRPKITKQVHGELLPEANQLLQTTEPPCDSEIMEEEECLIAESENLPDPLLE